MAPEVTQRVREILSTAEVDGLHIRLVGQLNRTDYVNANKALEALGGKWSRRDRAHVFTTSPQAALAEFIGGGAAPKPARTAEGYVATPPALADEIITRYTFIHALPAGAAVLEPSAGDGALVRAIRRVNPHVVVTGVEPNVERAAHIAVPPPLLIGVPATLEEFSAATEQRFAAVVMNPPFAVPGQPTLWIDHVRLAWDLLTPGGRLVSIVPAGFADRSDRRHTAMRAFITEHGGAAPLPADAFVASGTGVRTYVVWADR